MTTLEDKVQLETVNHKARTSWLVAAFIFVVVGGLCWVTETPYRWIPFVFAIAGGLGLYFALR